MALAPPKLPHDELEALIREARDRQRRRRIIGATIIATAAGVALGIYSLVGGFGEKGSTGGAPRASAPLCRSSQLSGAGGLNGAVGTLLGAVTLRNTSGVACALPAGRPNVRILWHGRVLSTREAGRARSRRGRVGVLGPHSTAAIWMDWTNWCGKPAGRAIQATFDLRWASGLRVEAPNIAIPPPRCDSPATASVLFVGTPTRD